MTKPIPPEQFARAPRRIDVRVVRGLPTAIDTVAEAAPASHAFLRRAWYDAALTAYGGQARTLLVTADGAPAMALPFVTKRPGLAMIPGCYWPFRGFPLADGAGDDILGVALASLAGAVRALRIGPVYDGDASVMPLIAAARARGWGVVGRFLADSFLLDMAAAQAEGAWPRNSTLRKNRFHEKHLASHGALDWSFVADDAWPGAFDDLAAIEWASWIASSTDGRDAKFTLAGHGAFWRAAATDPKLRAMFRAARLAVDGRPAAFSFDIDVGDLKYAIANSYDPAFAKHSPGKLLYYRNLVDALGRGITRVDWGMGDSGYKRVIGAAQGPAVRDWLLLRPGATAMLAGPISLFWRGR